MENANLDGVSESADKEEDSAARKRGRSPSREDSGSSSSSSSSSSDQSRRKRRKVNKTVSYENFEFLSQQVAFLTSMISNNIAVSNSNKGDHVLPNRDLAVDSNDLNLRRPTDTETQVNQLNLSEPSTTVKDPLYARANEVYLKKLIDLQRFKSDDWYAVRFADAQKKYLATPGFVELNVNDSLKRFEAAMLRDDPRSYLLERSFAGLTNAMLIQKDELQKTLQSLVDWAQESFSGQLLTPNTLFDKIRSLFSKASSYNKVTDDILQIVCGRRADFVTSRRDALLRQIPEQYHRDVLYKIPPNEEALFNDDLVQNYLQKIGGADKLFASQQTIRPQTKDNFYQNQKPSTSKQVDDTFFRRTTTSKRHAPRPSNRKNQEKSGNNKPKGKKSKPHTSFKNKRRE